jgi:putative spermidine/putrescine transport system substrate-binding protein
LKGQDRAPDVLDIGQSFAISAGKDGLLAPYKIASWADVPDATKDTDGTWLSDCGGFISIGYDPAKVPDPPTSFADLLKPEYKNMIAINGNPTEAAAAFALVFAAALAGGGAFDNIQPGVDYFKKLKDAGNFKPVKGSAATVQSGETPCMVYWEYLQQTQIANQVPTYKLTIPADSTYAAYYSQAISATAAHPAAARLWEEYVYSDEGQNLFLGGATRPIRLDALVKAGTVDKAAYDKLPKAPSGTVTYPTDAQQTAAQTIVSQQWATATGG